MIKFTLYKILTICILSIFVLSSCAREGFFKPGDARKNPPDPRERVKKNLEEGRGFRLMDSVGKNKGSTNFEFASSNELWRATLDTIEFMPLTSANYSGGIIISDWYSDNKNSKDSIKITIRFMSNEIRADAIEIKIFYRTCNNNFECDITEKKGNLDNELRREILKKAAIYEKQKK